MKRGLIRTASAAIVTLTVLAGTAAADETRAPLSAAMLLSIVRAPVAARTTAYDEALRAPAPAPPADAVETLPDGSLRYRRAIITVRNPCPPGHDEALMLPGRRR